MNIVEKLIYRFTIVLSKIVFRPRICEIKGIENLPKSGGFIIASNHVNPFDPFLIVAVIANFLRKNYLKKRKKLHYVGMVQLKKRVYSFFLNENLGFLTNTIEGANRAVKLLEEGNILGIFPEGRRNDNKGLLKAKKGVAFMALLSGLPVVPVACFGPKIRSFNQGLKGLLARKKVYFGKPLKFSPRELSELKENPEIPSMVTRAIMMEIGKLWGKEYKF
jgi:1-acyl-sn-glycerol-3-phosphate acyltransferase